MRYVFCSWLRNGDAGRSQFWHEKMRVLDLDGIRYSAHNPVLNSLRSTGHLEFQQLRYLGWATEIADQLGIGLGISHTHIKHHV